MCLCKEDTVQCPKLMAAVPIKRQCEREWTLGKQKKSRSPGPASHGVVTPTRRPAPPRTRHLTARARWHPGPAIRGPTRHSRRGTHLPARSLLVVGFLPHVPTTLTEPRTRAWPTHSLRSHSAGGGGGTCRRLTEPGSHHTTDARAAAEDPEGFGGGVPPGGPGRRFRGPRADGEKVKGPANRRSAAS
jgi:hypothetical protein